MRELLSQANRTILLNKQAESLAFAHHRQMYFFIFKYFLIKMEINIERRMPGRSRYN
jgi:hypothetical protein